MRIGKRIGLREGKATRDAFGEALRELGRERPNIVVVDGDVANSTRTELFGQEFPERFFSVGIAESNMVGVASGLALAGKEPWAASFACFIMCNAFDQLRMSVALPNLNVKIVGSHAGVTIGEDGPSQMGIEDVALACALPNFTVVVPADEPSTRAATRALAEHIGPAYLRTGRPKFPIVYANGCDDFRLGRAIRLRDGWDVTLIGNGLMVAACLEAAELLAEEGIQARVLDMHTVKPLDEEAVMQAARDSGAIVTAEEHLLRGGLGAAVAQAAARLHPVPMRFIGLNDVYAESGDPDTLLAAYGLTPEHIVAAALDVIRQK